MRLKAFQLLPVKWLLFDAFIYILLKQQEFNSPLHEADNRISGQLRFPRIEHGFLFNNCNSVATESYRMLRKSIVSRSNSKLFWSCWQPHNDINVDQRKFSKFSLRVFATFFVCLNSHHKSQSNTLKKENKNERKWNSWVMKELNVFMVFIRHNKGKIWMKY